jgi:hypothetical protein
MLSAFLDLPAPCLWCLMPPLPVRAAMLQAFMRLTSSGPVRYLQGHAISWLSIHQQGVFQRCEGGGRVVKEANCPGACCTVMHHPCYSAAWLALASEREQGEGGHDAQRHHVTWVCLGRNASITLNVQPKCPATCQPHPGTCLALTRGCGWSWGSGTQAGQPRAPLQGPHAAPRPGTHSTMQGRSDLAVVTVTAVSHSKQPAIHVMTLPGAKCRCCRCQASSSILMPTNSQVLARH